MFKFYEVGGCVRDELMGFFPKDYDYVAVFVDDKGEEYVPTVSAKTAFNELVRYLTNNNYKIFLTTPEAFTVRAKFPAKHKFAGVTADFVMARKEIGYQEGTRQPIVEVGTLLDDLSRRDFTVNAIAKDEKGKYIDPFNGQEDIKKRILRTPISGEITFDDDPLRLLRAIRFCITKEFKLSKEVMDFILNFDYDRRFQVVSEERIREELHKCFRANTILTLNLLQTFYRLRNYVFGETNLWLKITNEGRKLEKEGITSIDMGEIERNFRRVAEAEIIRNRLVRIEHDPPLPPPLEGENIAVNEVDEDELEDINF